VAIFPKLSSVYITILSYKQYVRYWVKSLYWFTVYMDDIYAILEVSSKTIPRNSALPRAVSDTPNHRSSIPQTNTESKFSGLLFSYVQIQKYADFVGIINLLTVPNHMNRIFLCISFSYSYVICTKCALLLQRNIFTVIRKQLWTKRWRMLRMTFTGLYK
jgi:hypothetical protein